jgi:hypothetical protein
MLDSSPDWLQELPTAEPVFVWSPIEGCGTELMRSLVCSSREVYLAQPDPFLLHDLPRAMRVQAREASLGPDGEPLPTLGPDARVPAAELYSTALIRGFAHLCGAYAESARRAGFRRWGTGLPVFPSQEAAVVRGLLPRSKHVLMLRHLEDAVRATRNDQREANTLRALALEWSDGVVRALGELRELPNVLVLRHEDLIAQPDQEIPRLCEFLRIASVDLGLIDDVRHGKPEAFRHELSQDAREQLERLAKPALELAGYDAPQRI